MTRAVIRWKEGFSSRFPLMAGLQYQLIRKRVGTLSRPVIRQLGGDRRATFNLDLIMTTSDRAEPSLLDAGASFPRPVMTTKSRCSINSRAATVGL